MVDRRRRLFALFALCCAETCAPAAAGLVVTRPARVCSRPGAYPQALRATGRITVALPCTPDEKVQCEAVFASPDLNKTYDVILVYADTYENPLRGSMTDAEWDGLFAFVKVSTPAAPKQTRSEPAPACAVYWTAFFVRPNPPSVLPVTTKIGR